MDTPLPVPWWVEILQLAETWSCRPWELVYDRGPTLWVIRYRIWSETVARATRDQRKHGGKR